MPRRISFFFDRLFRRYRLDRDMAEEFEFHVAARASDLECSGLPREEAERRARIEFGARNAYEEQVREGRWAAWCHDIVRDLRFAARTFRKAPGFTSVAVLTLAIGIASNTAVFTIVNALLLSQLPYPHPEQLVNIWRLHGQGWTGSMSVLELRAWQQQNSAFEGIAPYATRRFSLRGSSEPQAIEAARVGKDFFTVMDVAPFYGRSFIADDETRGRDRVVVIGYDLWKGEFGSDPHILGRTINLNDDKYTVIGIAPAGFHYPGPLTSAWVPLAPTPAELKRDAHDFLAVARLRPDSTIAQATAQLKTVSANMAKDHPDDVGLVGAKLVPLKEAAVGGVQDGLITAFVVVGFTFLIACANVATFLLSRAAARQREIAVRLAIGARPRRIVRQFLTEAFLLAILASAFALIAAKWLVIGILAFGRSYFYLAAPIHQDYHVALFTMSLAAFAAIGIALVVALNATRICVADALKEHATTVAGGRRRIRTQRVLVGAQVACAFFLLVGTGTLVQRFVKLSRVQLGFDAHNVLAMRVPISARRYNAEHPLSLFLQPALSRIRALPGVEAAGMITFLPMQSWGTTTDVGFTAATHQGDSEAWAETRAISPGYYAAMHTRILRGRDITDADNKGAARVAVVNETFVRRYSPEQDILGRQVFMTDNEPVTVVGVSEDTHQQGRDREPLPELDMPYAQTSWAFLTATMTLVVRTSGEPLDAAKATRQALQSVDPSQAVYGVTTMDDIIADLEGDRRFALWLLSTFSLLALLLAASGLFAQLSYAVTERMHEIGVRIALGAQPAHVVRMILRQCALVVALGMGAGACVSFALVRTLRSIVFAIDPTQVNVMVGAMIPIAFVAVAAAYIPARQAARTNPLIALRNE